MKNPGNIAFFTVFGSFAFIAILGIAFLGFTTVSLGLLLLCTALGVTIGLMAESAFNKNIEVPLNEQDTGLWPDDINDGKNKD